MTREALLAVQVRDTVATPVAANVATDVVITDRDTGSVTLYHVHADPDTLSQKIPGYLDPTPPAPRAHATIAVILVEGGSASVTCADQPLTVYIHDEGSPVTHPDESITAAPVQPNRAVQALEHAGSFIHL